MRARTHALRLLPVLLLLLVAVPIAKASGQGTIRIDPSWPLGVTSPATFTISVQPGGDTTYEPHVFLVMTAECYSGLSSVDPVTVTWTGDGVGDIVTIDKGGWTGPETDNDKKLPANVELVPGVGYTVASLKDHLGTTGPIYWAFKPFLDYPLNETAQSFTVTLPSANPRMLVYALGKTYETPNKFDNYFDNRIPPTIPGFVVPEPGTIIALATSLTALVAYKTYRKKAP